jgi:hypothetical protein
MMLLETIQRLQFTDKAGAEMLLLEFVNETFPQLEVERVELRPQAISLNSFNGFLTLEDDQKLFFKTHVEQDNVIGEYYNATMLKEAGYPIIQPLYSSTRSGQQILIYPVVTDPPVFDVARGLETQPFDEALFQDLKTAQNASDDDLYRRYLNTLAPEEILAAPIHQLFYHRLKGGRLDRFYGDGTEIRLPDGVFPLSEVRQWHWAINGSEYEETIDHLIHKAIGVLNPSVQTGLTIIGHGDAHNGNIFFNGDQQQLTYFDPAFAGRHPPLLDLTKPLFHNVFAMWMYFPQEEKQKLSIESTLDGNIRRVQHNYGLNIIRLMFLESKVERVLIPILQHLRSLDSLPHNWRTYLKSALFCCPFLTLDLKRFPPNISLLGLTMAVQMGGESQNSKSIIDTLLDRVEMVISG